MAAVSRAPSRGPAIDEIMSEMKRSVRDILGESPLHPLESPELTPPRITSPIRPKSPSHRPLSPSKPPTNAFGPTSPRLHSQTRHNMSIVAIRAIVDSYKSPDHFLPGGILSDTLPATPVSPPRPLSPAPQKNSPAVSARQSRRKIPSSSVPASPQPNSRISPAEPRRSRQRSAQSAPRDRLDRDHLDSDVDRKERNRSPDQERGRERRKNDKEQDEHLSVREKGRKKERRQRDDEDVEHPKRDHRERDLYHRENSDRDERSGGHRNRGERDRKPGAHKSRDANLETSSESESDPEDRRDRRHSSNVSPISPKKRRRAEEPRKARKSSAAESNVTPSKRQKGPLGRSPSHRKTEAGDERSSESAGVSGTTSGVPRIVIKMSSGPIAEPTRGSSSAKSRRKDRVDDNDERVIERGERRVSRDLQETPRGTKRRADKGDGYLSSPKRARSDRKARGDDSDIDSTTAAKTRGKERRKMSKASFRGDSDADSEESGVRVGRSRDPRLLGRSRRSDIIRKRASRSYNDEDLDEVPRVRSDQREEGRKASASKSVSRRDRSPSDRDIQTEKRLDRRAFRDVGDREKSREVDRVKDRNGDGIRVKERVTKRDEEFERTPVRDRERHRGTSRDKIAGGKDWKREEYREDNRGRANTRDRGPERDRGNERRERDRGGEQAPVGFKREKDRRGRDMDVDNEHGRSVSNPDGERRRGLEQGHNPNLDSTRDRNRERIRDQDSFKKRERVREPVGKERSKTAPAVGKIQLRSVPVPSKDRVTGVRSAPMGLKSEDVEMKEVPSAEPSGGAVTSPINARAHHVNLEAVRVKQREMERAFTKEKEQCDDLFGKKEYDKYEESAREALRLNFEWALAVESELRIGEQELRKMSGPEHSAKRRPVMTIYRNMAGSFVNEQVGRLESINRKGAAAFFRRATQKAYLRMALLQRTWAKDIKSSNDGLRRSVIDALSHAGSSSSVSLERGKLAQVKSMMDDFNNLIQIAEQVVSDIGDGHEEAGGECTIC